MDMIPFNTAAEREGTRESRHREALIHGPVGTARVTLAREKSTQRRSLREYQGGTLGHGDELRRLAKKFEAQNRYPNFGAALHSMEVQGFRGIDSLALEFKSPITALCGLNGTGKSTLAQLASCAYRPLQTAADVRRYYVKDYFPVSPADPSPFTPSASVVYEYTVQSAGDPQQVTVKRASKEWGGYKRQPERACYYLGFTQFLPKVERRDFSIYGGHLIQLGAARAMSDEVAGRVSAILGLAYDSLGFIEVSHKARSAELATAIRAGRSYSENHMGFGEGRAMYMVTAMETSPAQSLFILEEPETSLHGQAQERLGQYLVDVAQRRGHQVIMTTHSAAILGQFEKDSIAYLRRRPADGQIEVTPGLGAYQVDAYLRGDRAPGKRVICVEDLFAKQLVLALLRAHNRDLIPAVRFVLAGGHDQVRQAVRVLRESEVKSIGLTDGDCPGDTGRNGVLCLPGSAPPEVAVFSDPDVCRALAIEHGVDVSSALAAITDHHDYAAEIARLVGVEEVVAASIACDAYVAARSAREIERVLSFMSAEMS